jgi:serine phosphatase RsbU (regulator of sigma subunit)
VAAEELQPDDRGASPALSPENKTGRAFSRLKRELTDEELATPGVTKMFLEELERRREENSALESFRDRFYNADKELSIAKEKLKSSLSADIISTACLAVGAAALVYAPVVWTTQPSGWIALIFGAVLTIAGIIAKLIRL